MVVNLGGFGITLPGVAVCEAQVDYYEPFFAVDVGDFIEGSIANFTLTQGEAMDVNNDGYAVGWFLDNTSSTVPFAFSPIDGGSLMSVSLVVDANTTFDSAQMMAINSPVSGDIADALIVGWGQDDSSGFGHEPVYWTYSTTNSVWEPHLILSGSRANGEALALEKNGIVTGWFMVNGTSHVLHFDVNTGVNVDWGVGVAFGIRTNGMVVGDDDPKAFVQNGSDPSYIIGQSPNGDRLELDSGGIYTEHFARSINSGRNIVGGAGNGTTEQKAWAWVWNPTNSNWDPLMLSPLPSPFHKALAEDINDKNEVVGNYLSPTSVAGGFYLVGYQDVMGSTVWEGIDLDGNVLYSHVFGRNPDPIVDRAYAINDKAWIASSYKPDRTNGNVFRPCLLIPNDVDNDGEPDMREILLGQEEDQNNNWLLDWAENDLTNDTQNMRAGLHAPGTNGTDQPGSNGKKGTHMLFVDNVQIVRFPVQIAALPIGIMNVDDDLYSLEDIVNGNAQAGTGAPACADFWSRMREWATIDGQGGEQQREIVITVTNPYDGLYSDFDQPMVPTDPGYQDRLDTIRTFSYRFANCVDYMQLGNESLKGSSEWADSNGTPLFCLEDNNGSNAYTDLLNDGVHWVEAQAEAARIGSALGGRPFRVIAPGFPVGVINSGSDPNADPEGGLTNCDEDCATLKQKDDCPDSRNKMALDMREIGKIVKRDRMFFDVHIHYKTVDQALEGLMHMEDDSLKAWNDPVEGNVRPSMKVMLEFSPKGDKDLTIPDPNDPNNTINLWTQYIDPRMNAFFTSGQPGSPFDIWDKFIKLNDIDITQRGWELAQYEDQTYGNGFQMEQVLGLIDGDEYTAVCYGPSIQGPQAADPFIIAALRASQVKNSSWICDQTDKFSPLMRYISGWEQCSGIVPGVNDNYESIISQFVIPAAEFTPHCDSQGQACDGCDQTVACPPQ